MRARSQWKTTAIIVFVSLLIAVPIARFSPIFGGNAPNPYTTSLNQAQGAHDAHTQSLSAAQTQLDAAKKQAKTPFEQEMVKWGDAIMAASKAGAEANKQTLATVKASWDVSHK